MKSYKILIFILSVIAILAVVAYFFPKDGVKIGSTELHFPSIEEALVREPIETETVDPLVAIQDSIRMEELRSLKDITKKCLLAMRDSSIFPTTISLSSTGFLMRCGMRKPITV